MSKEEPILNPLSDQIQAALNHYDEISSKATHWMSIIPAALKAYEFSDQEKEKVAVAFAEWANDAGYDFDVINRVWVQYIDTDKMNQHKTSDLYQYFINNVYKP